MSETKGKYRLYEISDRLEEIEGILDEFNNADVPAEAHKIYLELLEDLGATKGELSSKVDGILSYVQSLKKMIQTRKEEVERLEKFIKKEEKTVEWFLKYLKQHLEKLDIKKLNTNKFKVSICKSSQAPLVIKYSDADKYPEKYRKVKVEVDKKQLREDIKNEDPEALKYGHFGDKSTHIRIK